MRGSSAAVQGTDSSMDQPWASTLPGNSSTKGNLNRATRWILKPRHKTAPYTDRAGRKKPIVRRFALLILFAACICPAIHAQDKDEISCYSYREDNAAQKKKLWDGYEISLGPSRNPDDVEFKCTAAIYNSAGRVVFRTKGFSVVFDQELTGEDFDGDGKPDVVFRADTGGGQHCCWGYVIYSLAPKPHKLFEIAMEGRVDFDKDKDGQMVIWQRAGGPAGFTSMAGRPFAAKVLRVREGKLVDVTQEYCGTKDQRLERGYVAPEDLKKLANTGERNF